MPTVALIGQSAVAYAGNLRIFSSDWYNFFNEQQLIVDAYSNTTSQLSGVELDAYAGIFSMPSPSWYSFYYEHQLLVNANGDGCAVLNSIDSISSLGLVVISGTENVSVIVDGVSAESGYGSIVATGEVTLDAQVSITGITASSSLYSLSANVLNPETWLSSGQIKRYPANAFKNSSVQIDGLNTYASIGDISAIGSIHINATATIDNVVSFAQVESISADGILSISEDELIMLLAA